MFKTFVCAGLCSLSFVFANASTACTFNPASQCITFAYGKYFKQGGEAQAFALAERACCVVSDLEVLSFLWSKHAKTNSSAHAMELSIKQAPGSLDGKLELISYGWSYYMSTEFDYSIAATKAARGASRVNDLDCVVSAMNKQHGDCKKTSLCIDMAFESCAIHSP